jgi:DNA topoisomerase IB
MTRAAGISIRFDFRGKHGAEHQIDLQNKRLAAIVRRCQELPGQELFQYLDEAGEPRAIDSDDVNEYLREITGEEITAKDFRTWAGTNLAALALRQLEHFDSQTKAKRNMVRAVEAASKMLSATRRRFAESATYTLRSSTVIWTQRRLPPDRPVRSEPCRPLFGAAPYLEQIVADRLRSAT